LTNPTHHHTQSVTTSTAEYSVPVAGTVDGESLRDPIGYANYDQSWENNLWTRMENLGNEAVINPWIHANGLRRWHSIEQIIDSIVEPGMTEADKARAIWEFARRHRYHKTTADDEVKDTVKMLNVYGFTLCWDEAFTMSNLWQAAGLKIRRGLPHGHCTSEVFYDGGWHLLDSDEHLLVLDRDNETIVGEAEISRDHDLMKRSHAYGILHPENRSDLEDVAAIFCHTGGRAGSRPRIGDHRMGVTLRPGEALTWGWGNRGRYHGLNDAPPRFCNGSLTWSPPLDETFARWTEAADSASSDANGVIADSLTWQLQAPYVMVGGRVELSLGESCARAELGRNDEWTELGSELTGDVSLDLDESFPPDSPAAYAVQLRLTGRGFALSKLNLELTLQMAPLSLPALHVGDNTVAYCDESANRDIEVTHAWRERDDLIAPVAPEPESPSEGAVEAGTTPTLRWSDTCGSGGDYHVRLGTDPALRWVLSPVFEKLISQTPSKGQACWTVPEAGLLNPDTTYFWQVRARSADGLWGPWSRTASFQVACPGVPLDLLLEMDWDARQGTLHWQPNPRGRLPVRYEIYGSNERGFSISREQYSIKAGESEADGTRVMPANFLFATEEDSAVVVGSAVEGGGHCAFYRVVAIDADGVRSGPSDYAEAPRPFVVTSPPERIPAGTTTAVVLHSIHSIGDLRAESDGPERYHTAIRDGDEMTFLLDEGPDFIELHPTSGELTLRPEPRHASTHTVTVRVKNGQGGVDVIGFDLVVTA